MTVFQTAIFNFLSQKSENREGKENCEIALSPWSLDHDFIMFSQKNKVNMKFVIFMIRRKMISMKTEQYLSYLGHWWSALGNVC